MGEKNKKLWFKRKKYGWGWVPVSWEGWVILAIYAFLIAFSFSSIDAAQDSVSDTLINFAPQFIILSIILIAICYKKGESPKWMWGEEEKK